MVDLNGRVRLLVDLSDSLDEPVLDSFNAVDKTTLIDYLNLSRLVMGRICKTQCIRLEVEKLIFDGELHSDNDDVEDLFDLEKNISLSQDSYVRCVGNFSHYMSVSELWNRVKSLDAELASSTRSLAFSVHNYIELFYDTKQSSEIKSQHDIPYIDSLLNINPNIVLLPFVDKDRVIKAVTQMSVSDISKLNRVMHSVMPRIKNDNVDHKSGFWKSLNAKVSSVKKENPVAAIATLLDKYYGICAELHVDRYTKYIMTHLPASTGMLKLLDKNLVQKFPDMNSYVDELDKTRLARENYDAIVVLLSAIIDAVAVLAAFRTCLLSKELQSVRYDATSTLLDVPDKADLEQFLSQIQPT